MIRILSIFSVGFIYWLERFLKLPAERQSVSMAKAYENQTWQQATFENDSWPETEQIGKKMGMLF